MGYLLRDATIEDALLHTQYLIERWALPGELHLELSHDPPGIEVGRYDCVGAHRVGPERPGDWVGGFISHGYLIKFLPVPSGVMVEEQTRQWMEKHPALKEAKAKLRECLEGVYPPGRPDGAGKRQGGRTAKTEERGLVFKELKDKNPEWSQHRVAAEASPILGEFVSESTVRYVYKAMGWKWERANKIR